MNGSQAWVDLAAVAPWVSPFRQCEATSLVSFGRQQQHRMYGLCRSV